MSNNTTISHENQIFLSSISDISFDTSISELINKAPRKVNTKNNFDLSHNSVDGFSKSIDALMADVEPNKSTNAESTDTTTASDINVMPMPTEFSEFPGNCCTFDLFCMQHPESVIQALFPNKSYKQIYDQFINYDTEHVCKHEMPLTLKVCEKLIFFRAMKTNDSVLPKEFKKHFNEKKYSILGNDIFAMIVAQLNVFTCEEIHKYANYKTDVLDAVESELSRRTLYKSSNKSLPATTQAMMEKYNLKQLYFNSSFEKVAELLQIDVETLEKIFQHIESLARQLNILLQGDRKIEVSKKKQNGENAQNILAYHDQLTNFVEDQKGKYQTFEKKPLLVQARLISVLRYTLYNTFGWNPWVCWFLIRKKCYDLAQNYGRIRDNMIKKGKLEALGVSKVLSQRKLYEKIIKLSEECKHAYELDPYEITLFDEARFKNEVSLVNNKGCENIEQFKKIYFNDELEFKELKNEDKKYLIPKFQKSKEKNLQEKKDSSIGNQFQFLKYHHEVQNQLAMALYSLGNNADEPCYKEAKTASHVSNIAEKYPRVLENTQVTKNTDAINNTFSEFLLQEQQFIKAQSIQSTQTVSANKKRKFDQEGPSKSMESSIDNIEYLNNGVKRVKNEPEQQMDTNDYLFVDNTDASLVDYSVESLFKELLTYDGQSSNAITGGENRYSKAELDLTLDLTQEIAFGNRTSNTDFFFNT